MLATIRVNRAIEAGNTPEQCRQAVVKLLALVILDLEALPRRARIESTLNSSNSTLYPGCISIDVAKLLKTV